jgi:F420-non-reducing hydrogenase iron-sulfur subunit
MCSGRLDPQFILDAFSKGADGVLVGGCHIGDCHYVEGNVKCLRRHTMLGRMLRDMGISEERLRLEWISASEGERVRTVINEMQHMIEGLGPLGMPQLFTDWDREMDTLDEAVQEQLSQTQTQPEAAHA